MGYTMRTDKWRITRWGIYNAKTGRPDFNTPPIGVELYDHSNDTEGDFDAFENVDLANNPEYAAFFKLTILIEFIEKSYIFTLDDVPRYNTTKESLLKLLELTWDNGKLPST